MAYAANTWRARQGTGLNRYQDQTGAYLTLTSAPNEITQEGTPFSADWMNHLEQGVQNAYPQLISIALGTNWTQVGSTEEYTQAITIPGLAAGGKVDLQTDAAVLAQLIDDGVSALWISNDSGAATAHAYGAAPTAALTLQAAITEVQA